MQKEFANSSEKYDERLIASKQALFDLENQRRSKNMGLLLVAAIVILFISFVLLGLSWSTYPSLRITDAAIQQNTRLQKLRGTIIHLDEVLTMSVRMAAATGDLSWEERYRRYEPQLDAAISELLEGVPPDGAGGPTTKTDATTIKLMQMERRAFELVRQNQAEEAESLLSSNLYETQKQSYAEGMRALADVLTVSSGDGSQKGSHCGSQKRGQVVREGVTWGCRCCELFRLGISSTRTGGSKGAQNGTA